MPNAKIKTESYQQFGGINEKYSPYVLGPMEFLNLKNLDFQTPGSLTARWGSTMYLGQTYPSYITSLNEFTFTGSSYIAVGFQGGIYYGATTGIAQGMSFTLEGATTFLTYAFSTYFATITPGGALVESEFGGLTQMIPTPFSTGGAQVNVACATFTITPTANLTSDNTLSAVVMNNFAFCADGGKFFKFDGVTTYPIGLPPVVRMASQCSIVNSGLSLAGLGGCTNLYVNLLTATDPYLGMGTTGMYVYYASYVNNRGFEGPIWPIRAIPYQSWVTGTSLAPLTSGATYFASRMFIYNPSQFGISSVNIYSYWQPNIDDATGASYKLNNDPNIWSNNNYVFLRNVPLTGGTVTPVDLGTSIGGMSFLWANIIGLPPDPAVQNYQPLTFGVSILNPPLLPSASLIPLMVPATNLASQNLKPRYLETYSNRLWLAGMSALPSTVFYSDLDEPEGYNVEWQFEVVAKRGDVITGLRSYQSRLYVFKLHSVHEVLGDDPTNFTQQLVTDQYGAVNNKCIIVFGDFMIFLDQRGVVLYNGGSIDVISNKKVQPTIDSINWRSAYSTACMVHDKARNQILIAVPTGINDTPDTILVYDYLAAAWTKYDGINVTAMMKGFGRFKQETTFYGNYQGMVNWFGASFLSDNGVGFTTYIKSRFLHDMGDSTQKQFRRLYYNTDPTGTTVILNTNFYQDYGTSIVKSMTIVQSGFQSRTEFGISGKALAFEMANIQTSIRLRVHGFTIESRMQRKV